MELFRENRPGIAFGSYHVCYLLLPVLCFSLSRVQEKINFGGRRTWLQCHHSVTCAIVSWDVLWGFASLLLLWHVGSSISIAGAWTSAISLLKNYGKRVWYIYLLVSLITDVDLIFFSFFFISCIWIKLLRINLSKWFSYILERHWMPLCMGSARVVDFKSQPPCPLGSIFLLMGESQAIICSSP